MFRGNVQTRLRKLDEGEVDATLLALAGLNRLGLQDRVREALDPLAAPPAPGQGALAIQTRDADSEAPWVLAMRHAPTTLALAAERGALEALEGSCRTAMGAYARLGPDGGMSLVVEAPGPRRFGPLAGGGGDRPRRRSLGPRPGAGPRTAGQGGGRGAAAARMSGPLRVWVTPRPAGGGRNGETASVGRPPSACRQPAGGPRPDAAGLVGGWCRSRGLHERQRRARLRRLDRGARIWPPSPWATRPPVRRGGRGSRTCVRRRATSRRWRP